MEGIVSATDSSLRRFDVRTIGAQMQESLSETTWICILLGALDLLGLILVSSGIYSVVSYIVADKYRDIVFGSR